MIAKNIIELRQRIQQACSRVGTEPSQITIVAVAKGRSIADIQEAVGCGITDIGENKIQEALFKFKSLTPDTCHLSPIHWHMVGHLQTNKVKEAVRKFDLIHSVDSLRLAKEIDRYAAKLGKIQNILIEVKTSTEATKFGIGSAQVLDLMRAIAGLKSIRVQGLMNIAAIAEDPQDARPHFQQLRVLRDRINELKITPRPLLTLSMGMSDDFEVAIEEGANMVRVGRAIFGS